MKIISNSKCAAIAGGYIRRIDLLVDAQMVVSPIKWGFEDPVPSPVAQLQPGFVGTSHPLPDICPYPAAGFAE